MDDLLKNNVVIRSRIVDAQNKKIFAELDIVTLLVEIGDKENAEIMLSRVKKDINTLISQHWYESLLSELEALVKSLK